MTDAETITLFLEFIGHTEAEKAVSAGGGIEYCSDFEECNTFRIQEDIVSLCVLDKGWIRLNPREDMNAAAFLIKTLHDHVHDQLDRSSITRRNKIIFTKLHDMVINAQKRFATLEMPIIYDGIFELAEQIQKSTKWIQE